MALEQIRHDLVRNTDRGRQRDQHEELLRTATALLRTHGPTDFELARRREHVPGQHNRAFGVFGTPEKIVCVTDFPPEVDITGDTAIVTAAGSRITVPSAALPALDSFLGGQPASIAEVTARTGIVAVHLAEALVTAGVCTEVTPALAAAYEGMVGSVHATA